MKNTHENQKFIEAWSVMAAYLGVSRSESQVFALLLLRNEPMSSKEITEALNISRGNTHQALHKLMNNELVYKFHHLGERKEYFKAEHNLWLVFEKMIKQLKYRSLDKLAETIDKIPIEDDMNPVHSPLEKIKSELVSIIKAYNDLVNNLPKSEKDHPNNISHIKALRWPIKTILSKLADTPV